MQNMNERKRHNTESSHVKYVYGLNMRVGTTRCICTTSRSGLFSKGYRKRI